MGQGPTSNLESCDYPLACHPVVLRARRQNVITFSLVALHMF